jgi:hypothetical protein
MALGNRLRQFGFTSVLRQTLPRSILLVTVASVVAACDPPSRPTAFFWAPPTITRQLAAQYSATDVLDRTMSTGRTGEVPNGSVKPISPANWTAVLVSGSHSLPVYDNAVRDLTQWLHLRGVQRIAAVVASGRVTDAEYNADKAGIERAFAATASSTNDGCLFFATGHGNRFGLSLDLQSGRKPLTSSDVARWLNAFCGRKPTVVIVSSCDAGVFLDARLATPNRIIIVASSLGRVSYGAKLTERHVNFDRCFFAALNSEARTWRNAFDATIPCIEERERWLGVRSSLPQIFAGGTVSNLPVPRF